LVLENPPSAIGVAAPPQSGLGGARHYSLSETLLVKGDAIVVAFDMQLTIGLADTGSVLPQPPKRSPCI
jgi:hypothetical protein